MTEATLEARFWAKVAKAPTGCWEWQAATDRHGYGFIGLGVRAVGTGRAHRVSYVLAYGSVPKGMCVLHRCDNPPCVNPVHLFLGSRADNMRDMKAKGRAASGERNGSRTQPGAIRRGEQLPQTKISDAEVRQARLLWETGKWRQSHLAEKYRISQSNISRIVNAVSRRTA